MEKIKYASDEDIINISLPISEKKSGIPFIFNGEKRVINNNYHTLAIADDDKQKYDKIINPLIEQISLSEESFVISSNNRKIYEKYNSLLKDKGYNVICLDFDNPANFDSFNILELAYNLYKNNNQDKAIEIIENVGYYIFYDKETKNLDSFWINSAISLFIGIVLYSFDKEQKFELNKIRDLLDIIKIEDIEKNTPMYNYLSGTFLAPNETKGGIISVFNQKFNMIVTRESLCKMLSNSNFDLKDITNKKQAIFMIEGTNNISKNLISLIINQIYYICNIYDNNNKINMIIDNFDELCPIKNVENIIYSFNNYNVILTTFIKSFTRMEKIYGDDGIPIIMTYFKNLLYLLSADLKTLEYISELCGKPEYVSNLMNMKENEALYIIRIRG